MRKIIISFWASGLTCFALAFGIIIYLLLPLSAAKEIPPPHALDQLVLNSPSDPTIYYRRGVSFLAQHQLELAETDFLKSLELKPEQPDVFYHLSLVEVQRQNWQGALNYLNQTLGISPDHARALLNRSYVQASMGRRSLARQDLKIALKQKKADADPYEYLAYQCQVHPSPGVLSQFPAHPEHENTLRAKAYCAVQLGEGEQALSIYQVLWFRYARLKDYFGMARAQHTLGNLAQAQYILEKIAWADPSFQPAQMMLAQTLFSQGQHEKLKNMLAALPEDMPLTAILRLRYAPSKDHLDKVNRLLASEPWRGNAYYAMAQYYFQEGDMRQALAAAERAWEKDPGVLAHGRFLWELYMQENQVQKAQKLKRALIQADPEVAFELE